MVIPLGVQLLPATTLNKQWESERPGPTRRDCPGTGSFHVRAPWLSVGRAPILGSAGKAAKMMQR